MWRKLLIFTSVVSALMAVVLAAAWTRSYFARDTVDWSAASQRVDRSEWRTISIRIGRGQFRIDSSQGTNVGTAVRLESLPSPGMKWKSQEPFAVYMPIYGPPPAFDFLSLVFATNRYSIPSWDDKGETRFFGWYLVVPFWLPTGLTCVAPIAVLAVALKRRHQAGRGLCKSCGYDLRASSNNCPECGTGRPIDP